MKYLLIIFSILLACTAKAQFQTNNNALSLGGNRYRLTEDMPNMAGSMWYILEHDLTQPLNIQGQLFLGSNDVGADGICFVMQDQCLNAGTAGGGIGYSAMPGNSIAVEFDTYENSSTSGGAFDNSDPTYDHIAVEIMGNVDHANAANTIAGPVAATVPTADIEDGLYHDFQISYTPATQLLEVYFDNVLRISTTYDILTNVFGGDPYVYWGFTSSTGGFNNYQEVYIDKDLTTYTIPDASICTGSVTLPAPLPSLTRFAGKNVALGKTTTVSSYLNTLAGAEAVDGSNSTRWESDWSDPQWIQIDLGTFYDLSSVTLDWEAARASDFTIDVSPDGITWTNAVNIVGGAGRPFTGAPPHYIESYTITNTNVRYVRMNGTQRTLGAYGYSLWEFQVYGTPKYVWSPDDGSISPDIYSNNPTFSPLTTTTYTLIYPDQCTGATVYNMTITIDCPTPVKLVSFDVERIGNQGHLSWVTSMELNTSFFTIMKSSDGIHFYPIGQVNAYGNSNTSQYYTFDDPELPAQGVVYYQLISNDIDGYQEKSVIKELTLSTKYIYVLNPVFDDETSLILTGMGENEWVELSIVDVLGRVLYKEKFTHIENGAIPFGKALAPSTAFYIVGVQTTNSFQSFKVVKRK